MSATVNYNGTVSGNTPPGWNGTSHTLTLSSGILICSIAAPYTSGSQQYNGVILQYGQDRSEDNIFDATPGVFMGRTKPVVEFGQYAFLQGQQTYRLPPSYVNLGGYYPGRGFDNRDGVSNLRDMLAQQIGTGAGGNTRLVQIQDIWGTSSGTAVAGGTLVGLVGMLYNFSIKRLVNPSGWVEVTFSFSEVEV